MSAIYITDKKHDNCISGGDTYDGHLYHLKIPVDRLNAMWVLEPLVKMEEENHCYIRDAKHGKCIVAGDTYDGHLYHQDPNGRDNAVWQLKKVVEGEEVYYRILDRKHGKCIVAGDTYDRHLYHQDPNGRDNAIWKLTPAPAGNTFIIKGLRLKPIIQYTIKNYPEHTTLNHDKIVDTIGAACQKWEDALRSLGRPVSFVYIKPNTTRSVDMTFEWGDVKEINVLQYRAAETSGSSVTFSNKCKWSDLDPSKLKKDLTPDPFMLREAIKELGNLFGILPNETDLLSVAVHEIGHVLGLDHTNIPHSIMNKTVTSWDVRYMHGYPISNVDKDLLRVRLEAEDK